MTFDPPAFLSGLGGILLGGAVIRLWLRNMLTEMRDLRKEIQALKTERIAGLEKRIDQLERNCKGVQVVEQLRNISGWMNKLDMRLAAIADETAEQRSKISADHEFIFDVSHEFRRHAADRSLHHG